MHKSTKEINTAATPISTVHENCMLYFILIKNSVEAFISFFAVTVSRFNQVEDGTKWLKVLQCLSTCNVLYSGGYNGNACAYTVQYHLLGRYHY